MIDADYERFAVTFFRRWEVLVTGTHVPHAAYAARYPVDGLWTAGVGRWHLQVEDTAAKVRQVKGTSIQVLFDGDAERRILQHLPQPSEDWGCTLQCDRCSIRDLCPASRHPGPIVRSKPANAHASRLHGMVHFNQDGEIIACNETWARAADHEISGNPEELVGLRTWEVYGGGEATRIRQSGMHRRIIESGYSTWTTHRYGQPSVYEGILASDGTITVFVTNMRKASPVGILTNSLSESKTTSYVHFKANGEILDCNQAYVELGNHRYKSRGELLGKKWWDITGERGLESRMRKRLATIRDMGHYCWISDRPTRRWLREGRVLDDGTFTVMTTALENTSERIKGSRAIGFWSHSKQEVVHGD